jgi:LacI family transcriptional regulator, galactose operon repressor
MRKIPHVALLIETSRGYGRGILFGVIRYLRERGPWSVYIRPHDLGAPPPPWLENWRGDGILVRVADARMARAIRRRGLPAVDLRAHDPKSDLPYIVLDNREVVRLAFEHLLSSGFKQFGFCSLPRGRNRWMDLRSDLFREMVTAKNYPCHVFAQRGGAGSSWEDVQEEIAAWLIQLPKPIGVMACNDDRGEQVLDACRRVSIPVPDEVAVVGVDNDEILCNLSSPPLSTVDIDAPRIGYEAAAMLGRMMAGKQAPRHGVYLLPRGVVCRESTDVLATDDRRLAAAIRFIRQHACEGLRLKDFAQETQLSRRALERRMQKLLGRSPKEEISRVQIGRAKQLLDETDLAMGRIAEMCGFSQPKYFSQVFRAKVGMSPRDYRNNR